MCLRRALDQTETRRHRGDCTGVLRIRACARPFAGEDSPKFGNLSPDLRGYAFCKAHSTAYGVEAYQSAWLKRYLSGRVHGRRADQRQRLLPSARLCSGMSSARSETSAAVGERTRTGLRAARQSIRVPLTRVKGLTTRTTDAILAARERGPFDFVGGFLPPRLRQQAKNWKR